MIITCPSCSARYLVGSNDIGHGRQVKCKRCDFSWFQDNDSFVEGQEDLISEVSAPNQKGRSASDDANLPVLYKTQRGSLPLPFLILIFASGFVLCDLIFDNISINAFSVSQSINSYIDQIVNYLATLFN